MQDQYCASQEGNLNEIETYNSFALTSSIFDFISLMSTNYSTKVVFLNGHHYIAYHENKYYAWYEYCRYK